MADLATLKLRHDALRSQRSSGVARVSYDGKSVDYRSVAEIDRAIEALEREIALAEGRRMVRQVRITTALFAHFKQDSIHAKFMPKKRSPCLNVVDILEVNEEVIRITEHTMVESRA